MSDKYTIKPPVWFWVFAVLFVVWGLIGCSIYLVEVSLSDAAYEKFSSPEMLAARDVVPIWGIIGFATAVWSGLLASILFILRKRVSVAIFILSLIAAIIGFLPTFFNSTIRDAGGSSFWVMPLIVVTIGAFQIFYSRKQRANGILR